MENTFNGVNSGRGGRYYCKEAIAYFALVPDMPDFCKNAIDKRIKAFKQNGVWGGIKQLLLSPYTLDKFNGFIDAKKLIIEATPTTVSSSPFTVPYFIPAVYNGNQGFCFYKGLIYTNLIPANSLILNNTCIAAGFPAASAALSGSALLAIQSATQVMQINPNDSFGKSIFDSYGSGAGGRISEVGTNGAKGAYLANRQSATNFKGWKNTTVVASTNSTSGILPTISFQMNTSSRNEPISYVCIYGSGLSDEQAKQEQTDWITFLADMNRNIEPTKVLLVDGNSHGAIWIGRMERILEWNFMLAKDFNWKYWNVAVAGQTIQQMNSDYSSEVNPLLTAAAYTKKIVVIFGEPTNAIEAGTALSTIQTDYQTYCSSARSSGALVVVTPMFARNYTTVQKCLDADSWNTWLEANWSTFADAYVPQPNGNYWIPRSGSTSDANYKTDITNFCTNTNYFYDGLHLTEFGYTEWGNAIYSVIKNL